MNSILIITLIAFVAFLLLTGFGIMRDFSRLWLKHSAKVFAGKQGVNYYSELATTLVVVLFIAIAAAVSKVLPPSLWPWQPPKILQLLPPR